jgi:hypothetical protein
MFSLRDLIWQYFYGGELPPQNLISKEIMVSIVIAILFLGLYWIFKLIIFHGINDDIRKARTGAITLSVALSAAWLIASLDLLGLWASVIALVLFVFALFVDLVYLVVTRA